MKMRKSTKMFFWLTIVFLVTGAFLLWSVRGANLRMATGGWFGFNPQYLAAIATISLAGLFGFISFIRFIRSKSVAGGLFFIMTTSTAVFFAANAFLITSPVAANTAAGAVATSAAVVPTVSPLVGLAQIGLFAIWFLILLIAVYAQVRPIKKIERALNDIINNSEKVNFKVGKGKQFASIENKLNTVAKTIYKGNIVQQLHVQKREEQKPTQGEIIVA